MSDLEKSKLVDNARGFAKWFSVDVVIKMFGHVIWEYHFPPKTNVS